MVTHSFRKSYSTLKTIHKNKYPTASMDSIELHGVKVDEKQLKILIYIAKLRVQAENVDFCNTFTASRLDFSPISVHTVRVLAVFLRDQ